MSEVPFEIRPISLEEDMDGKVALASKRIEVSVKNFTDKCEKKDLQEIIKQSANENILLSADFFLKIADAPDKKPQKESSLILPLIFSLGIVLGIALFGPFYFGISFLMFSLVSALVFLTGIFLGTVIAKNEEKRIKAFFEKMEKNLQTWKSMFINK